MVNSVRVYQLARAVPFVDVGRVVSSMLQQQLHHFQMTIRRRQKEGAKSLKVCNFLLLLLLFLQHLPLLLR